MAKARSIVVTGASTGIGRAVVARAVKKGARVHAAVRSEKDAASLTAEFGASVEPVLMDVTDAAAVNAAAAQVAQRQGGVRLAALVNNAGMSVAGPLLLMSDEELHTQFNVNVFGVHRVTRAFAPLLGAEGPHALTGGDPGKIVMISSVGGKRALPFIAAYASSKFAVEGYSEGLRRELMPFGVDVVVVGPGAISTPIWQKGLSFDRARYATSVYGPILERFAGAVAGMEKGALPADAVGALVWRIIADARPKVRYGIQRDWLSGWIQGRIPPRALDGVLARTFGMGRAP